MGAKKDNRVSPSAASPGLLGELLVRHQRYIAQVVRRRAPRNLLAQFPVEDLVQTTVLRAWRRRKDFDYQGDSAFRGWIATMAERVMTRRRHGLRITYDGLGDAAARLVDPSLDPRSAMGQSEEEGSVMCAFHALPQAERDVISLRVFRGYTVDQCAEILKCAPITVRRHLESGLQRLGVSIRRTVYWISR